MTDAAESEIEELWRWLAAHRPQLKALSGPEDPTWDRVLDRLHRLSSGIYFELSRDIIPREMIFTSHGDRRLFPLIDRIVRAAPEWPDWKFFSLKPPRGMIRRSRVSGVDFRPEDFWFVPLRSRRDPIFLGIRVWIPGFHDRIDDKPYIEEVWHIIDALVGERESGELVDHVEVCGTPEDPVTAGFDRIQELEPFLRAERIRKTKAAQPGATDNPVSAPRI